MTSQIRLLWIALALIAVQSPAASAEDGATHLLRAGDLWIYRSELHEDGQTRTVRSELSVAYPNRAGNWVIAARPADAPPNTVRVPTAAVDGHGCIVDVSGQQTLQAPPCTSPVKVGDTWKLSLGADKFREVRVLGKEIVAVPAGSFEALRLESVDHDRLVVSGSQRADVATSRTTSWFADALGVIVRAERASLRADGSVARQSVDVLESFAHVDPSRIQTTRLAAPPPDLGKRAPRVLRPESCRPAYPAAAVRSGATGTTHVRLAIGADGRATDAEVVGASGETREHRLLDNAARDAMATCLFQPASSEAGTPMAVTWDAFFTWKLDP